MIIAYTALHYGSPYLAYAIRSVIDAVDEYYVLYAAQGSHGTGRGDGAPASETRDHLHAIAQDAAGDKLRWIDGDWRIEGDQRDAIFAIAPYADAVLVLDYDEIWPDRLAQTVIETALSSGEKFHRVAMIHYWRSFYRAFLHDPAWPTRVIIPGGAGEKYHGAVPINHMGYAIPDELLRYKMTVHGHKAEFRRDIDWYNERWIANAQQDCHPVGSEFWNTDIVMPDQYMPGFMRDHPYYELEVIE